MSKQRMLHIVLSLLAVFAAAVLFVTYGTVLPSAPFAAIGIDGPSEADSDGELSVVVDTGSRRALIMNAEGDLTGVVDCSITDSPINAITDVCVVDGLVYLSGVRFAPDSDLIEKERVAAYDKGGNLVGTFFELPGDNSTSTRIKSLNDDPNGVVVSYVENVADASSEAVANLQEGQTEAAAKAIEAAANASKMVFCLVNVDGEREIKSIDSRGIAIHDTAYSADDGGLFATLDIFGTVSDDVSEYASLASDGHVFTAIDIEDGIVYACDDATGSLCAVSRDSADVRTLVPGEGYHEVHVNSGIISLCKLEANKVTLCRESGEVVREFSEVRPSVGFSARMLLVWASGAYLVVLALVLVALKLRRLVKERKTEGIGPVFLSVAVVVALALAVGSFSASSYRASLELRANEINMCADYLNAASANMSETMEKLADRNAPRGSEEQMQALVQGAAGITDPAIALVDAANNNMIGMYCNLYGKDDQGVFYLYGSADEHVLGTSAQTSDASALDGAFQVGGTKGQGLLTGRTLRDTTQYRLVQVLSPERDKVVGVIEVGSKMRTFESSITGRLAQRILALLVLVLVVYLAYSEIRACARCLFDYRERRRNDEMRAVAVLTRPFTLAITMLTSIDSVMTVLIARDLLSRAGMGESSPLLALPAVMLGIGMIIGQGLYGFFGSRVGLRRLMVSGALVMMLCACFTCAAVTIGGFWVYCVAKLTMSIPFGLLYTLGYSLPRLADSDEVRANAAGGVKRTDTSAAALGTVLGGYAAQMLGNVWVYVLIAIMCLPVVLMSLNLLPRGTLPLEKLAQPDNLTGRVLDLVKTRNALALAFFVVLPATVAAGYTSFLFPLFSADLGLSKAEVNNIAVLGQLVVYLCINQIDRTEAVHGKWKVSTVAIALLGVVFLLFSVNATLLWSVAVVALVGVLGKSSDGWKAMWLANAGEVGVPAGRATGAMFATRSLALIVQPSILGALLGAANQVAVIVIGAICVVCALLFFLTTRNSSLTGK